VGSGIPKRRRRFLDESSFEERALAVITLALLLNVVMMALT